MLPQAAYTLREERGDALTGRGEMDVSKAGQMHMDTAAGGDVQQQLTLTGSAKALDVLLPISSLYSIVMSMVPALDSQTSGHPE